MKPTEDRSTWTDYTAHFSQLFNEAGTAERVPMYSYERPAYLFWSAFMNGLRAAGYTEKQAIEWLTSKHARWALDGALGDEIEKLAFNYARKA
jgi:hypothetical protein